MTGRRTRTLEWHRERMEDHRDTGLHEVWHWLRHPADLGRQYRYRVRFLLPHMIRLIPASWARAACRRYDRRVRGLLPEGGYVAPPPAVAPLDVKGTDGSASCPLCGCLTRITVAGLLYAHPGQDLAAAGSRPAECGASRRTLVGARELALQKDRERAALRRRAHP